MAHVTLRRKLLGEIPFASYLVQGSATYGTYAKQFLMACRSSMFNILILLDSHRRYIYLDLYKNTL